MLNSKDKLSGRFSMNGDKSKTSKPWIHFHESLDTSKKNKGGKERARHIMKPVKEYNKNAKKILEIGCGLGDVLVERARRA